MTRPTGSWGVGEAVLCAWLLAAGGGAAAEQQSQPPDDSGRKPDDSGPRPDDSGRKPDDFERTLDAALAQHAAGRIPEAAALFDRAGREAEQAGAAETAAALRNNACVLFNQLGHHRQALAACERAMELRPDSTDAVASRTLNNLGLSLLNLGRLDQAERQFRRALELNRALGEIDGEVVNLTNLALVAEQRGAYAVATGWLERAVATAGAHANQGWAPERLAAARLNLAVVHERTGNYPEAFRLLRELEREGPADPRSSAFVLGNLGVVYRNLGDPIAALDRFAQAEHLYRRIEDDGGIASMLLNRGIVEYLDLDDPETAIARLDEARTRASTNGDLAMEMETLYHLGQARLARGDSSAAREAFASSLELAAQVDSTEGRWSALYGLGLSDRAARRPRDALQHLESALDVIEQVRESLPNRVQRATYFAEKRDVYGATISLLAAEGNELVPDAARAALAIAHRAKARLLLDLLTRGDSSEGTGLQSIARPAAVEEIARALGDALLVEYAFADGRLYRWTLFRSELTLTDLGPLAASLGPVRELVRQLATDQATIEVDELSSVLVPPIASRPAEIVIAADGLLRYLPFELLESTGGSKLIELAPVRYLPSGALATGDDSAEEFALDYIGVAVPGTAPAQHEDPARLPPLRHAVEEVQRAGKLLGPRSELAIGPAATERHVREVLAHSSRVLHFAAHAVLREEPPAGAAIVLAASPDESDARLTAPEIAALDLPAELAILSACSASLGLADDAGALESLVGAFLAAGTRAVVATLWEVDDQASAIVVDQLTYELARGATAAEALRRTKLRLLADPRWRDHPGRWAGFVLFGDPVTITSDRRARRRRWIALLATAAVVSGAVAGVLYTRRRVL